jgi:hypothetical protein
MRRAGEPHEHRGDTPALEEELLAGYRHSDLDECLRVCKELLARGHWKWILAFVKKVTDIPLSDCSLCGGSGISQKVDAVYPDKPPLNPRPAPCFCLGEGVNPEQARWGANLIRLVGPESWGDKTCTADFSNRPRSEIHAHQLTYCYIQNGCRACPAYKQVPDVLPGYLFFLDKAVPRWDLWLVEQDEWGTRDITYTNLGVRKYIQGFGVTLLLDEDSDLETITYTRPPGTRKCPPLPFVPWKVAHP